jgi:hypothetical protein
VTRAQLRTRVRRVLNDPDGVFLPDATLNALLDEAQEFLAEQGSPVQRRIGIPLRGGWTYYRLSAFLPRAIAPVRMQIRSTGNTLTPTTVGELDAVSAEWETTTGTPNAWFVRGWDQFGLYPTPTSSGDLLWIDAYVWPDPLLRDESTPEFSSADQEALVLYAWADGLAKGQQPDTLKTAWDRLLKIAIPEGRQRTFRLPDASSQRGQANGNSAGTP